MTPSPAATFATRLVRAFAALGVEHAIVSPGSRSQALALALAALENEGRITLHVRIDERDAAFTALGIARESGRPALVVTTSGTAVANLLPAVVEASHSGVPLIVLAADRPEGLRGTGSNQTTWQPGIFGRFVRREFDVDAPRPDAIPDARALAAEAFAAAVGGVAGAGAGRAAGAGGAASAGGTGVADADRAGGAAEATDAAASAGAGPVHVNLQFVEPLSGEIEAEGDPETVDAGETSGGDGSPAGDGRARADAMSGADEGAEWRHPAVSTVVVHVERGPRTVVIAGADAGEAANEFALAAGWPLLAEVSSGARFGPNLVVLYRELLAHDDFGGRVERAVVFGHPTLSREVPALLARDDVETIVVRGAGEPVRPHARTLVADAVTADPEDRFDRAARAWTGQWVFASRELLEQQSDEVAAPLVSAGGSDDLAAAREFARAELAALRAPISRRALALAVWRATWPHDRLVLGASRLIRELDAVAPGKKITVHANRGLAGIDGTVSTAVGIALASQTAPLAGGASRTGAGAGTGAAARARAGTTRVLLGDVTLLHDVGGLLLGAGEVRPRIQLVVGNDGGGTIFDSLEVAGTADRDAFDRVMFTPHRVDLAALAAAYGWQHRLVTGRGDLDSALASPAAGPSILEVPLAR
ncbi:thiamine pyrophosphate-binding protein [Herbiconiux daphne]|uniref:2-succinyl-5-enolpyruvyl-6-hydroxy-3-cyclohexene-1-carboxylate synthase n=1 Tax=Herbiconiux daphne TaxID=2970914 RepID=A0ABT2GWB4_9MICO|nr:thiamine pyrophosphate-binding protein [Herbiconiux daphne]MCS5732196.1 thiamine pyrophosphate-binding protein [Herbiconiux daphne]